MRKKKTRYLIYLTLFTLLLVGCVRSQPEIHLETASFSFGTVENGDTLQRSVGLSNRGRAPLVIQEVSTSCSCTTGTIDPRTIPPGESGVLKIEFNSGAHGPELEGRVKRQIFITSNDSQNKEAVVEFTAEIVAPDPTD